jgi:hypothetical protein
MPSESRGTSFLAIQRGCSEGEGVPCLLAAVVAQFTSLSLSLSLSLSGTNNNIPAGKESRRRSRREALLATKFLITAAGRDRSRPAGQPALSEAIRNPRESRVNNLLRIIVYGFPRYGIRGGGGAALGNVSSFPAGGSSPLFPRPLPSPPRAISV